ncbi:hypothetical protein BJF93_22665 [Xaviernesmea oryzae]|uniref:Uncharacterized protein n=1 Tax=Xaviernesmea oryzae TaxID=464029 RepID=A0A1Q9B3B4_9HYPH|nr:hypothetical protein BJF93_22665 [Xaviernesmea oryzae]
MADAYGGEIGHWPQDLRPAAEAFAQTSAGKAVLEEAAQIDSLLDRFTVASPSASLQMQILKSGARRGAWHRALRRVLIGAGLLGVGLAGGLAGAAAVMIAVPAPALIAEDGVTAFGGLSPDVASSEEKPGLMPAGEGRQ